MLFAQHSVHPAGAANFKRPRKGDDSIHNGALYDEASGHRAESEAERLKKLKLRYSSDEPTGLLACAKKSLPAKI
jgi:hypothetical protein